VDEAAEAPPELLGAWPATAQKHMQEISDISRVSVQMGERDRGTRRVQQAGNATAASQPSIRKDIQQAAHSGPTCALTAGLAGPREHALVARVRRASDIEAAAVSSEDEKQTRNAESVERAAVRRIQLTAGNGIAKANSWLAQQSTRFSPVAGDVTRASEADARRRGGVGHSRDGAGDGCERHT
jgi:hypothetical protein